MPNKNLASTTNLKITPVKKRRWPIMLIVLIILGALISWWVFRTKNLEEVRTQTAQIERLPTINGNLVEVELAKQRPLAVVIENSPEARPQAGLSDAEIVYETVAEGGITRFLAIFQSREPETIGPVRSARPYFNLLANMWSAGMVHSGGSQQALSELSSGMHSKLYDINEFYYGKYFFRNPKLNAPHNLFTNIENLRKLLTDKNQTNWEPITAWEFENTPTDQLTLSVTEINIPFSGPLFRASYLYDPTTNSYQRSVGGKAHLDRNNDLQISAKNILIQLTDIVPTGDELLTVNVRLTGSGLCYYFSSGKFLECKWSYENGKHVYTDLDNNSLKLQTGLTWITIFPRDKQNLIQWIGAPAEPNADQPNPQ